MSSYFIYKVENQKGEEEQLLKIDPTKLKIIQGVGSAAIIPSKMTTIDLEKQSEESEFDKNSILSSSLSQNFVCSPCSTQSSTFPKLLLSEPTLPIVQGFDNRQAFHSIDLNARMTISGLPLTIVPSSLLHPNPVDNMESSLAKKIKTEVCLPLAEDNQDSYKVNWTEAEIQLLLEQRLSMNDKFENPNTRKTPYWNIIVKAFEKEGYKVKVNDLVNKWKNLQVTYNRNVSKLKRTGESAITWKYFQQMHEIFAEKKSVNPVEASLGSTFKPETLTLSEDESTDDIYKENADAIENVQKQEKRKPSKKTRFQEEMLRLVEEKKSQSLKLKREIWEDKKKIATSKIEAINNLAILLKEKKNA